MSKAWKCDRCGGFFEPYNYDPEKELVITTRTKLSNCTKIYDLCPKCVEDLRKWFFEYKEVEHD